MKTILLTSVVIEKYKSFESSQSFEVGNDITVIVGKNESGKTAALESIAKTRYFTNDPKFKFDPVHDYPRKEKKQYDKSGVVGKVATCRYLISESLLQQIAEDIGEKTLQSPAFAIQTYYNNNSTVVGFSTSLKEMLSFKAGAFGLSAQEKTKLLSIVDYSSLEQALNNEQQAQYQLQNAENAKAGAAGILADILPASRLLTCLLSLGKYVQAAGNWNPLDHYVYFTWILPHLPKFLYYDEYYALPSRVDINRLQGSQLESDELKTSKALFELADININDLISGSSFETYIAELEATSNLITKQLFEYWTTNKDLRVRFQMDKQFFGNYPQYILDIRVENLKHMMSLPLGNRSTGFNWFFSFIVWFSKIQEDKNSNYILLLDEPGLNLHASAQADLLRFIEDLSQRYQILYTSHSPFMVDADKLTRVRTIVDGPKGSEITDSLRERDPDTLFPLQAALGYDIAQNLFVAKNNLLVEGPADLLYLSVVSAGLEAAGRTGLKDGVAVVPVGGMDKVATFISLLRTSKFNIVCLLDDTTEAAGKQRPDDVIKQKIIKDKNVRFFKDFSGVTGNKVGIEDLFEKSEYLKLVQLAYPENSKIKLSDFKTPNAPILPQVSEVIGKTRFNHYRPAQALAKNGTEGFLGAGTLDRFEKMFSAINALF